MELNRDQIIKALECCTKIREDGLLDIDCYECPFAVGEDDCKRLDEYALALIKELAEERDGFENLALAAIETQNRLSETIEELTEDNKRLSKALNTDISIVRVSRGSGKTAHLREVGRIKAEAIRADTVREMAKRLKGCREKVDGLAFRLVSFDTIDKIKEEMINEKNTDTI